MYRFGMTMVRESIGKIFLPFTPAQRQQEKVPRNNPDCRTTGQHGEGKAFTLQRAAILQVGAALDANIVWVRPQAMGVGLFHQRWECGTQPLPRDGRSLCFSQPTDCSAPDGY